MDTTAGTHGCDDRPDLTERSPRARRVVEVRLKIVDDRAMLRVRSTGRRGVHVRELWAPALTASHAAGAVARHYGLVRTAADRWQAPEELGTSAARRAG